MHKVPTTALDHLKVVPPAITDLSGWSTGVTYNTTISDMTLITCYICGGSGHFFEICPMHISLEERFGNNGRRKALYGRAINLMIEKQHGHHK